MNWTRILMIMVIGLAGMAAVVVLFQMMLPAQSNAVTAAADPAVRTVRELPAPDMNLAFPLVRAIHLRRSVRNFRPAPLSDEQLSALLWSGQGITGRERGLRAAPSAGATYPIELFVLDRHGIHRYLPARHSIETISVQDRRRDLTRAALNQDSIVQAPVVVVIAADYSRTTGRYGDRGRRYVYIETGHVAQNIHLQAVALGLGSVPIGAFNDDAVNRLLGLPANLETLYIIPVGYEAL
ncbi:MAG TPA: SagB/ThcOx family dehydrogenase [Sedimentisphaerales bacterium]|nr:SagB/ThcOx family dehydrogenase [Sedimentisphaerales bacterium]